MIGQTYGFLFSLADLLRYCVDRISATAAAKAGAPLEPVKPPKRYQVPRIPQPRLAYVLVVGTLLLACPIALAFASRDHPQKPTTSPAHGADGAGQGNNE